MKAFLILSVLIAMANAQGTKVNVVDHANNGVHVVDQPNLPNNGVNVVNNPDPFYYQNPGGNGAAVIDPGFYYNPYHSPEGYAANGGSVVIPNPDSYFAGGNGATSGGFQPDGSQYPAHLYPGPGGRPGNVHPGARGGNTQ